MGHLYMTTVQQAVYHELPPQPSLHRCIRSPLTFGQLHSTPLCGSRSALGDNSRGLVAQWSCHGRAYSSRATAKRGRGDEDDFVRLDDEEGYGQEGAGFAPVLGQAWGMALGAVERLIDIAYDFAPENVSRQVVSTSVRAGLILVVLGFARSILGFLLTIGTVVFGLYVASRVLGIEAAGGSGVRPRGKDRGGGGSRMRPPRMRRRPLQLPSGLAEDGDVIDVWYNTKAVDKAPRRR